MLEVDGTIVAQNCWVHFEFCPLIGLVLIGAEPPEAWTPRLTIQTIQTASNPTMAERQLKPFTSVQTSGRFCSKSPLLQGHQRWRKVAGRLNWIRSKLVECHGELPDQAQRIKKARSVAGLSLTARSVEAVKITQSPFTVALAGADHQDVALRRTV